MYHWIMGIYGLVKSQRSDKQNDEDSIDNIYNCRKAEEFMFKACVRLTLWSNIMCEKFGSDNFTPSSSACENEFKTIKHLMGINTRKMSVFVNDYLRQTLGRFNLALANQQRVYKEKPIPIRKQRSKSFSKAEDSSELCEPLNCSQSENDLTNDVPESLHRSRRDSLLIDDIKKEASEKWKGRNRSPSQLRRARSSILNPHNIDYVCHDIPVLKNGSVTKSRKADKKSLVFTHTCSIDSITAIYCAAYLDN